MAQRFLEPSSAGLRLPTDSQKENGQVINPPRYAEMGGLDGPRRTAQKNPLSITKPGSKRG